MPPFSAMAAPEGSAACKSPGDQIFGIGNQVCAAMVRYQNEHGILAPRWVERFDGIENLPQQRIDGARKIRNLARDSILVPDAIGSRKIQRDERRQAVPLQIGDGPPRHLAVESVQSIGLPARKLTISAKVGGAARAAPFQYWLK